MTIDAWLTSAIEDVERRGLPELRPLLESIAQATRALREADFNDNAAIDPPPADVHPSTARDGSQPRAENHRSR